MRTIKDLVSDGNKCYVYLANAEIGRKFLTQAEDEGFTFSDGVKPTDRSYAEVMCVNGNYTINYVGAYGRIAFGAGVSKVGDTSLTRVDFEKYISGAEDYSYVRR